MITLILLACPAPDKAPAGADDTGATTDTTPTDSPGDSVGTTTTPTPEQVDDDGDGYSEEEGDCDDLRASVSPGLTEDCETWADDDCQGGNGNNGCEGHGWLATYGQFDWDTVDAEPVGVFGRKVVGNYGKVVCAGGGALVPADTPPPPCPDCLWTFASAQAYDDPWEVGPCDEIAEIGNLSIPPPAYDWGFSYMEPGTGSSGPGWLLRYDALPLGWYVFAGPGGHLEAEYSLTHIGQSASFYWYIYNVDAYYTYWRYGEPTRAYNP